MTRQMLLIGVLVWGGSGLLLSRWARLDRVSLADRLRPFHPGSGQQAERRSASGRPLLMTVVPLVEAVGDRLSGVFGVGERPSVRLARIHSSTSPQAFRLRQAGWAIAAAVAGALVAAVLPIPAPVALLLIAGPPLLAFLLLEQGLARSSEEWQRRTAQELPVIEEQLAMLLNAGFSLGASLGRVADRGHGCVARDVEVVLNRTRQGLSEADALGEWAERAGSDPVRRLVAVLTLYSEAGDLGRLVSIEARQARRDLHRETLAVIERRSQQVWVPVTVATLVPGAILLAVPFLAALRLFSNA